MNSEKIEGIGAFLSVFLFVLGTLGISVDVGNYMFLASGTAAGALLGALGGQKFGLMEMDKQTIFIKIISNVAVVVGVGPAAMDYCLKMWPEENSGISPSSMCSLIGFVLAIFGTSFLIMFTPLVVASLRNLLTKFKWLQANTSVTTTSNNPPSPPTQT
jgi:hypothetical protein